VLVDSGASISCIDWDFVQKHHLPTERLPTPVHTRNADNSINKKGVICFTSTLFLNLEGITRRITFHVLSLGSENVILGLPWLKEVNPTIDWAKRTLSVPKSLDQSKDLFLSHTMDTSRHDSHFKCPTLRPPRHVHVNAITDQKRYEFNDWEEENQYLSRAIENRVIYRIIHCGSRFIPIGSPVITKLTAATELALAMEKPKPSLSFPQNMLNSPLYSPRKPMTNYCTLDPMTMKSTSMNPLCPK
jgi:hypothetical protein